MVSSNSRLSQTFSISFADGNFNRLLDVIHAFREMQLVVIWFEKGNTVHRRCTENKHNVFILENANGNSSYQRTYTYLYICKGFMVMWDDHHHITISSGYLYRQQQTEHHSSTQTIPHQDVQPPFHGPRIIKHEIFLIWLTLLLNERILFMLSLSSFRKVINLMRAKASQVKSKPKGKSNQWNAVKIFTLGCFPRDQKCTQGTNIHPS